tara:strand:+ start:12260 stop:12643 length:384 start_codon:yes stop_codon:yes gene_type:complete
MDNDIKKQRYYIYENINKLSNHNQIIDLINMKACKYTENDNGIFLNLNTIDEKIITMVYHIVLNTINFKEKIYNIDVDEKDEIIVENTNNISDNTEINKGKKDNSLSYKHFSKKDQKIIDYSKKYNL